MKNKYHFDYYLTRLLLFRVPILNKTDIFDIFQTGSQLKIRSAISFFESNNNYVIADSRLKF